MIYISGNLIVYNQHANIRRTPTNRQFINCMVYNKYDEIHFNPPSSPNCCMDMSRIEMPIEQNSFCFMPCSFTEFCEQD